MLSDKEKTLVNRYAIPWNKQESKEKGIKAKFHEYQYIKVLKAKGKI